MTRRPGQGQIVAALAGSLLLAAVLSGPRAASEESPVRSAAVTDERPLAALVALLEERHGVVITYEDPTYRFEGDLTAAAGWPPVTEAGWQPRAIRQSSLSLSYRAPDARDGFAGLTAVLQEAIDLQAAAGNPGRFRLERDGSFLHVIPSEVKGQDGRWKPASSILDFKVDLADADRQLGDAIDLILDAVRSTRGVRVDVVQEPLNSARRIHVRLGATGESVRHLLTRAVANFGPGFSWRLLFDTRTGRTGLQIYKAAWASEPWAYAAVDSESPADRPPLSDHRDSAGLLGAMIDGDVAIMFFESPQFRTCPTEQLRGLRVTFSALNARHEGVARLVNGWLGHRVEFKPGKAEERLTVTLQSVPLDAVLYRLAGLGAVRVLEPPPLSRAP